MAAKRKTTAKSKSAKKTTVKSKSAKKTTAKRKPAAKKAVKRTAAKPAAKRKPAAKKAAKPVAATKTVKRSTLPVKKAFTKSQIAAELSGVVGISKKQVNDVFAELSHLISRHVKQGGAGSFNIPGLLKIATVRKKATKARKGVNPFTKEPCVFKAKPARTVIKVRALKGLKDMA